MAVYLVQHGLSLPKEKDPEKGLSEKGIEDTTKIAEVAGFYNISVSNIFHSGKKRAVQTAEIFKDNLKLPDAAQQITGINPLDDVPRFAERINSGSNDMIVGHLPFMQHLVSYLTTGDIGTRVYRFQNSGIVCMECEAGDWYIKWTLNPNID